MTSINTLNCLLHRLADTTDDIRYVNRTYTMFLGENRTVLRELYNIEQKWDLLHPTPSTKKRMADVLETVFVEELKKKHLKAPVFIGRTHLQLMSTYVYRLEKATVAGREEKEWQEKVIIMGQLLERRAEAEAFAVISRS